MYGQGHQGGGPPAWAGQGGGRQGEQGTAGNATGVNPLPPDAQATEPAWGFATATPVGAAETAPIPGQTADPGFGNLPAGQPNGVDPNHVPNGQSADSGHTEGEIPPWVEVKAPESEQTGFDLNGWLLIGGVIAAAVLLILGGLVGLQWATRKMKD